MRELCQTTERAVRTVVKARTSIMPCSCSVAMLSERCCLYVAFLSLYYNALRERNGDSELARIVIGKDTRRSSYIFEYSLVAGLTASGADSYLLHVTTTPSVAYLARADDFDCGIIISVGHNLYYDNGIKLIDC